MMKKRLIAFLHNPHIPWTFLLMVRRVAPRLYRWLRYGATNPNTRNYWDKVYTEEINVGDMRDHDYGLLHEEIKSHVKREMRVLDAGCGTGALLRKFAEIPDVELYGCDLSSVAVNAVSDICVAARQISLPHLPPDWQAHFDLVTCTEVLEHLDDPEQAVASMAKCVRKTGQLIVSVPNDCMHPDEMDVHVQSFDAQRLESLLLRFFLRVETKSISGCGDNKYLVGLGAFPRI